MSARKRCFFDVAVDNEPLGRIVFELFADIVPKTVENFRCLCTGERGFSQHTQKMLHYKGAPFHRIIDGFMVQGGDTTLGNGRGGESIYGGPFEDEHLEQPVDKEGLLVMANRGPNTNSSQFFITLADAPHLTGKHVVFGQVVSGLQHVQALAKLETDPKDRPLQPVIISHCGELERKAKAAPVRARSESRSVSPSPSQSSDSSEPRQKKRKHRSEAEKAEKRAKKEAKRARKEEKRLRKKLKREAEREPTAEEKLAKIRQEEEEEKRKEDAAREARQAEVRRRKEVERLKEKLGGEAPSTGINYRGRGQMRYREEGGGMKGW